MRKIRAERSGEFWVALITAAVVVFVGVEQGIILAIVLSLLLHVRFGYKPRNSVLAAEGGRLHTVPLPDAAETLPGLVVYRFNHNMYYANSELLSEEVLTLAKLGPEPVKWLCCDLVAVDDVDFSAAATLRELVQELRERGTQMVFSSATDAVRGQLDVSGVSGLVGQDAYFPDPAAVLEAYRGKAGVAETA
jgi:MFS superfamily sulfate permease-like transporter